MLFAWNLLKKRQGVYFVLINILLAIFTSCSAIWVIDIDSTDFGSHVKLEDEGKTIQSTRQVRVVVFDVTKQKFEGIDYLMAPSQKKNIRLLITITA